MTGELQTYSYPILTDTPIYIFYGPKTNNPPTYFIQMREAFRTKHDAQKLKVQIGIDEKSILKNWAFLKYNIKDNDKDIDLGNFFVDLFFSLKLSASRNTLHNQHGGKRWNFGMDRFLFSLSKVL